MQRYWRSFERESAQVRPAARSWKANHALEPSSPARLTFASAGEKSVVVGVAAMYEDGGTSAPRRNPREKPLRFTGEQPEAVRV